MSSAYVVTGGGRGIGRAVVERLLADGHSVVAVEVDPDSLRWTAGHPARSRVVSVEGSASDEAVTEHAADLAESAGTLRGWVNNAALFRDASLDTSPTRTVLELISAVMDPAVTGCATAVRRFLAEGTQGSVVNITSHQARRPVPGCTPYATAKAAIEGLTRALAVEYGPHGIRVNAVAPGSIGTERYASLLAAQEPDVAARVEAEMRALHPLGRTGLPEEVASAVAHLLSSEAAYITGVTLPVDGGRTVLGRDPDLLQNAGA
ncbi:SDR family NAD(P)-dependent oxidoreductase [Streptomyces sp. WMMB 322]|uniref:SDR family NAD(P)-dependent oxidoreductase n=1 Tax=Streptomyces sp. WMMB 322 TaxID=1286821 RepID=UPI0006E30370|nr:SDR family oxidoreductase [Streptomyces sp. WMMB 322]SCK57050.1 NAD(P)-dependent dehydrogenase, short-chain alcohol dehydrogenase family [Streptomyces sp. WMMB 322]